VPTSVLLLIGGPAGVGKSTLAKLWCGSRDRAVHIELDEVRGMIASGLADPQGAKTRLQAEQYALAVEASVALARVFLSAGYDVVIDDTLEPAAYSRYWRPLLTDEPHGIVILTAGLDETLGRSGARAKAVLEIHTEQQHASVSGWDRAVILDTSRQIPAQSLRSLGRLLEDRSTEGPR
jgi:predicted kinase